MDERHSCYGCDHRDDDWCKWSDAQWQSMPRHVTWGSIDPANLQWAKDCPAHTSPQDEDDE